MNRVELLGHVISAVNLRKIGDDKSKVDFLVAITRPDSQQGRDIVRVVAWSSLADDAAAKLAKGSQLKVEGRLNGYFYPRNAPRGTKVDLRCEVVAATLQELDVVRDTSADAASEDASGPEASPAPTKSKRSWLPGGDSR